MFLLPNSRFNLKAMPPPPQKKLYLSSWRHMRKSALSNVQQKRLVSRFQLRNATNATLTAGT
jgi:hypothetical protein